MGGWLGRAPRWWPIRPPRRKPRSWHPPGPLRILSIAWIAAVWFPHAAAATSLVCGPDLCRFAMILHGASELAQGWAHTRTSLGMCWSRYVLSGPGSSFAPFPSGMAEMPNRGSFQDCAAKHRVWLVSTRDGFRTLPASLKTRDGRCTAFLSIVHESG